jgi:hypothetical protein
MTEIGYNEVKKLLEISSALIDETQVVCSIPSEISVPVEYCIQFDSSDEDESDITSFSFIGDRVIIKNTGYDIFGDEKYNIDILSWNEVCARYDSARILRWREFYTELMEILDTGKYAPLLIVEDSYEQSRCNIDDVSASSLKQIHCESNLAEEGYAIDSPEVATILNKYKISEKLKLTLHESRITVNK